MGGPHAVVGARTHKCVTAECSAHLNPSPPTRDEPLSPSLGSSNLNKSPHCGKQRRARAGAGNATVSPSEGSCPKGAVRHCPPLCPQVMPLNGARRFASLLQACAVSRRGLQKAPHHSKLFSTGCKKLIIK